MGSVLLDGKYQVLKILGSGGFGTVYMAKENISESLVAIKRLKETKLQGIIKDEIKALAKFNHPNIITYKHQFEYNNDLHIVMEYCSHGSLRALMCKENIRSSFVWKWVKTIAETMQFVHEKGIFHHDIKPDNILFTDDRILKIADFGVANKNIGTPSYLPPEWWDAKNDLTDDPRIDIFSLGVTLIELLTKQNPFSGKNYDEIEMMYDDMDFGISYLPNWQQEIILKAIAFVPELRFQSMNDFYQAIESESIPYILNKDNIKAGNLAEKANDLISKKKWIKAYNLLYMAEKELKPNAMVMTTLGKYHLKMNNISRAKAYFDKALKWNSKIDVQKELGWINLELKNYPIAISLLSDYIHRNPTDHEAYNLIIQCYYENNRYEQAHDLANSLLDLNDKNINCFLSNYYLSWYMKDLNAPYFKMDELKYWKLMYSKSDNAILNYNYAVLLKEELKSHNYLKNPTLKSKLLFMDYRFEAMNKSKSCTLYWKIAHSDEQYFKLDAPIITIGRHGFHQNTIMIPDGNIVSRRHCVIVNCKDDVWLYDLESTGTIVNNQRLKGKMPLIGKNFIRIGKTEIEITDNPNKLL
jgi:serine/threonine protein kinase